MSTKSNEFSESARRLTPLLALMLSLGACNDEAPPKPISNESGVASNQEPSAPIPTTKAPELKTAPLVQERSTFKTEVLSFGIYDSGLQNVDLPKGYEDELPGPRLVVTGRILNASKEPIHRGGVFGHLKVCAESNKCVERPSHGRGFTVPLSGTQPWRPGTWRHFTVLTRSTDPVYREIKPEAVTGRLELKAQGPIDVDWEDEVWNSPVPWRAFGGYAVMQPSKLTAPVRQANLSLKTGEPIYVLAVAGMKAYVRSGKRAAWLPLEDLPVPRDILGHIAKATRLPKKSTGEGLQVTVHTARTEVMTAKEKDEVERRFFIIDVEVEATMEKRGRLSTHAFELVAGHHDSVGPEKKSTVSAQMLAFGAVDKGSRRRGELVFELPFGVNPLVLTVRADQASFLEVVF